MSNVKQLAVEKKAQNWKDEKSKENDGVLPVIRKGGEKSEENNWHNHQRHMGRPVMEYSIKDIKKRASSFSMEGIHDHLAFEVE